MKIALLGGAILALLMAVSACGQRGPLVLPAPAKPPNATAAKTPEPAPR